MWVSVGLERTDNNMELTTWPQVNMINQKNYYTSVTPSCCEVGYIVLVAHIRSFPVQINEGLIVKYWTAKLSLPLENT